MSAAPRARAFVALALGTELGLRVAAEVERVLGREGFRLADGAGLHLTLAFLGDIERERLETLREALAQPTRGLAAPALRLTGTGAFPNPARPRVLWVGVAESDGAGRLAACRAAVLAGLAHADFHGVGEEREGFNPHVSVARPRAGHRRVPPEFAALRIGLDGVGFVWAPAGVELFESRMEPGGSRYESLARFPFSEPP